MSPPMPAAKPPAKTNGKTPKVDPFSKGVWVLVTLGGLDVIGCVDGMEDEEDVRAMLLETGALSATITRKVVLERVTFAARDPKSQVIEPGSLPLASTHETRLELAHAFPSHMIAVSMVSFLSEFHPDDVERLRQIVYLAEAASLARTAVAETAQQSRS